MVFFITYYEGIVNVIKVDTLNIDKYLPRLAVTYLKKYEICEWKVHIFLYVLYGQLAKYDTCLLGCHVTRYEGCDGGVQIFN